MASRRKLKKAINFVSTELVTEMYILSFFKEVDEKALDALVGRAIDMNEELISRINHVDGKKDSKIVKTYFNKIRQDWTDTVADIVDEVGKL